MKPVNSKHVSRDKTVVVDTGESVGGCDSKTTHDSMFFPSPVIGGCDELAVVGVAAGWKRASLGGL